MKSGNGKKDEFSVRCGERGDESEEWKGKREGLWFIAKGERQKDV